MHVLARICVERPVFATVLSLALLVIGLAGRMQLGVDRFPNIDAPMIAVSTSYPGASPQEVETSITDRIERHVNTIGGINRLTSTSSEGLSLVNIEFDLNKDVDVASEEVRAKVAAAQGELPPDARQPVVSKFDASSMAVVSYAIASPRPLRETYEYVDKKVRRALETVSGVGEVSIIGGRARQINVVLDPLRLRSYGLTARDVSDALKQQNSETPGGLLEGGRTELTLRTQGRLTRVADFTQLMLRSDGARPVLLGDVASVEDGDARTTSVASVNGHEAVVVEVIKQSGTNAVKVADQIKTRVAALRQTMPAGFTVTLVSDQSMYVRASLNAVQEHLVLGSILAAIVVLVFLADLRSTLIAALAIPLSVLGTFAFMRVMGFTQNIITLLALTLSVGIVIDDAIVVLENVHRVLVEQHLSPAQAAIQATREIGLAVVAITLSLLAVFLPVAFMSGMMGRILNSFGLTMAAAIAMSMYVSFSLTPMLCSRWLRAEPPGAEARHGADTASDRGGWYRLVDQGYAALLEWSLRHRGVVWLVSGLLIVSVLPLALVANKDFLVQDDESQFGLQVRMPEGTSLAACRAELEGIAHHAAQLPEVKLVMVKVGSDQQQTRNLGKVFVKMNEVEERRDRRVTQDSNMARARREILPLYAGRGYRLSVRSESSIGGGAASIQIAVSGPDLAQLARYSEAAVARCAKLPGVADADSSLITGKGELRAVIDRVRAADLGSKVEDVAQVLRLAVSGDDKVTSFEEAGEQYEVHVRLAPAYRQDEAGLELLDVPSSAGPGAGDSTVPLGQVVRFEHGTAAASVDHFNRQRQFTLSVNLAPDTAMGTGIAAVQQVLAEMHMAEGYHYGFTGMSGDFAKTFLNFGLAFLLSGLFMYLVIAAQFESFRQAFAILLILPLTVPFALVSIIATHDSLNVMSLLGILVLLGVVKKNSILQVDRANQLREAGLDLHQATVQAARDRLRPILMTTIAFVAGMVPLVLSRGTGAATSHTTGSVIIGGQVLSLLLTLVAAPVFYTSIELASERRATRRRSGRQLTPSGSQETVTP